MWQMFIYFLAMKKITNLKLFQCFLHLLQMFDLDPNFKIVSLSAMEKLEHLITTDFLWFFIPLKCLFRLRNFWELGLGDFLVVYKFQNELMKDVKTTTTEKKLTKSRNWRNYRIRLDFDKENHVWIALSLYEHPRRPSTSETLTIFGLWSSKLEKLFLTGVFGRHFVSRTENQRGGSFSCLNALKNKSLTLPGHFDRFKMVHVDSQIKEFLKFKSKILPKVSSKPI